MPALPPAPKALKTVVEGVMGASNWANIWYLQYAGAGPPTSADLDTLSASFMTAYSNFGPVMDNTVAVSRVVVTDLNSNTGAQGAGGTGFAGSKIGDGLPISVALCVTKTVARRYRGGHPRFYLPGMVVQDCLNERVWLTTVVSAVKAKCDLFFTAANAISTTTTGTVKLANVSYYFTSPPRTPPQLRPVPIVELITGFKVDQRIDSQRRRLN